MLPPNSNIYLETSAVNHMANFHSYLDGKATQIYHERKGSHFFISPVTIWEILLTTETDRRETLIYYLQHLADPRLLKSPAELVIDYLEAGCPSEPGTLQVASTIPLAEAWRDVCSDSRKTFIFNQQDFRQHAEGVRVWFTRIQSMITQPESISNDPEWLAKAGLSLDSLLRGMKTKDYTKMTAYNQEQIKIAFMLMAVVLCYGIGFDEDLIERYWKKRKMTSKVDQIIYLFNTYESLLYQGPIAVMAHMVHSQMQPGSKRNRGILWDGLHAIYLLYADIVLSNDQHFKNLHSDRYHLFKKIVFLKEAPMHSVETIAIKPEQFTGYQQVQYFFHKTISRFKTTFRSFFNQVE